MSKFLQDFMQGRIAFNARFGKEPEACVLGADVANEMKVAGQRENLLLPVDPGHDDQLPFGLRYVLCGIVCIEDGGISRGMAYFVGEHGRLWISMGKPPDEVVALRAARQELAATCDAAMMLLSDETDFEDKDCDVVRIIEGLGRVKAYVEGGGVPITVLDHLGEAIESTDRGDPAGTESKGGE